jgi:enamine deaminase RidA (YjgF/YER057c/UK114 family)
MISGTASIGVNGKTAHVGDIEAQIALTMDVVKAILESRGFSWSDAYRSIAYVKRSADAPFFEAYFREKDLPDLCHVCTEADVCREDLLFELEIEAVRPVVR